MIVCMVLSHSTPVLSGDDWLLYFMGGRVRLLFELLIIWGKENCVMDRRWGGDYGTTTLFIIYNLQRSIQHQDFYNESDFSMSDSGRQDWYNPTGLMLLLRYDPNLIDLRGTWHKLSIALPSLYEPSSIHRWIGSRSDPTSLIKNLSCSRSCNGSLAKCSAVFLDISAASVIPSSMLIT